MTYANMDNVPSQVSGSSSVLATDWNTYVRDNFDDIKAGHVVVADAAARTGLPNVVAGTMVYESATSKLYMYSGSSWIEIHDLTTTGGMAKVGPGRLVVADSAGRAALGVPITGTTVYQADTGRTYTYTAGGWVLADIPSATSLSSRMAATVTFNNQSSFATFGRPELRTTFTKRYTSSSVLCNLSVAMIEITAGLRQEYAMGMYNPTSGSVEIASGYIPEQATSRGPYSGTNIIWSGLAAGTYTVEPVFRDKSAASSFTFYGGGVYNSLNSIFSYTLLEVN